MSKELFATIPAELSGERADKAVCALVPEVSRSSVQRMLQEGKITLNEALISKNRLVKAGEVLRVVLVSQETDAPQAQNIPLDIRYEDNDILVVNKPKGMTVHPAAGNYSGTLVNALLFHRSGNLSGINGEIRPGIVHRLDRDTSGLLIVAKNDSAHIKLAQQIKEHTFKREYRAVVVGRIKSDCGTINAPLGRSDKDRKKQAVGAKNSKNALTHFEVLERFNSFTYVKLLLETGRTHQIRVHMAFRGNPLAGDTVYGGPKNKCSFNGQCLHAALIGFNHPTTGEYIEVEAELPEYFESFLGRIR
ncbi:MAG: Ribosomal large subunit pseudouridine synthase D [Firmicutes bacterium ADurb.Bin300]|jgi:23S rRNA pseudouridine1911/1915/1917 synthase|nr:MAG: Ribosomal large subunit pseudouridine synthase D [Firmicutes bacterium ADurb.Bin300]